MADAALQVNDALLTPAQIEEITGIQGAHPIAQRNRLRSWGIKAEINGHKQVVCFWSWVAAAAALRGADGARYIPAAPANDRDGGDIGMNLEALHSG